MPVVFISDKFCLWNETIQYVLQVFAKKYQMRWLIAEM